MLIPEALLKEIKCCIGTDDHFVEEPLLLKCGGNACKKCINDSIETKCYRCNNKHEKTEMLNLTINKTAEAIIDVFSEDILKHLDKQLETIEETLNGFLFFNIFYFFI